MMEPKTNDPSGLSQTSMNVMNSVEGRQTVHRRPVGLTITVEMIDRVLTDIQTQIEFLRRERTTLGLVWGQLAAMEAKWRGECTTPAYLPSGRAAGLLDLDCEGYDDMRLLSRTQCMYCVTIVLHEKWHITARR